MVKSALRIVDILEFVAGTASGASHAEIAAGLAIPKSSLSGLLGDLRATGYLDFNPRSRMYIIGPEVLHLATAFNRQFDLVQVGAAAVADVVEQVGESCKLTIRDGVDILVVYHKSAPRQVVATMKMGDRAPLFATAAGKAMLAFMAPDERRDVLEQIKWERFTEKTNTDRALLEAELDAIARGKAALSLEEYILGQVTIAYPIRADDGAAIAAISIAAPVSRWNAALAERCRSALAGAAAQLATRLGFR